MVFTTVLSFINFSFIYFSPLPLPLYSNTHRGRQFYILTTSTCSRSSIEIKTNMCLQSFLSLSVSFFTSLSQLNPKGQQLWKVNGEVSKIKSRKKLYLLLRLKEKVTFLKVKLGKLIANRTSKNQSSLQRVNKPDFQLFDFCVSFYSSPQGRSLCDYRRQGLHYFSFIISVS